jgi:hypothetical protein
VTALGERQDQMLFCIDPIPRGQVPLGFSRIEIAFPVPFFDLRRDPSGEADTELEQPSDDQYDLSPLIGIGKSIL